MANCPWLKNGCCSRGGMHVVSALHPTDYGICFGKQVKGKRYTNCQYYVNPKERASGNTRPCPLCERRENSKRYFAYCYSAKRPGANGNTPVYVQNDREAAICIGRTMNGRKYTSCPYYYRGGNQVVREKKKEIQKHEEKQQQNKKIIWFFVIVCIILWIYVNS